MLIKTNYNLGLITLHTEYRIHTLRKIKSYNTAQSSMFLSGKFLLCKV